jgi:hypothetical protein
MLYMFLSYSPLQVGNRLLKKCYVFHAVVDFVLILPRAHGV